MKYRALPVEVDAFTIVHVDAPDTEGNRQVLLDNGVVVIITAEMAARHKPMVGDYFVVQQDGYEYINPRTVFVRKYEKIEP